MIRGLSPKDEIEIRKAFQDANYFWIVLPMFLGILSHISRAIRWKMLLQPLGYTPKLSTTFYAIMAGYLANFAVPRLGEITRCGVLNKYEKIPFSQSFGTVIAERAIDLLCLILLSFITVISQFDKIYNYTSENIIIPLQLKFSSFLENHFFIYFLIALIVIATLLFFLLKKISGKTTTKFRAIFMEFWTGMKTIRNIKNPFFFFLHSLFIWTMYYLMIHLCFYAFNDTYHLGIGTGLAILVFGSAGVIAVPGGIGAYPFIVTEVLKLYSIIATTGIAFGWIVWTSQAILILVLGLLSFIMLPMQKNKNETA